MPGIGQKDITIYVKSREEWREWLTNNHNQYSEIWLLYYKKHTCRPRIPYDDAVEEAICFGWIDSIVKTIDEISYCQKFTPRKKISRWSEINIARAKKMISEGKMTHSGLKFYEQTLRDPTLIIKSIDPAIELTMAPDLIAALKKSNDAYSYFTASSKSYRNMCIRWIEAAKKSETRKKRIDELAEKSNRGEKIGLK